MAFEKMDKPLQAPLVERNRRRSAVVRVRVDKVLNWLLAGLTTAEIQKAAAKTDWGVNERQVRNYIHAANEELEHAAEYHRPRELGRAIMRLHGLFAKSLSVNDYARCLLHQKELNHLLGLAEPTRSEIAGAGGGPIVTVGASLSPAALAGLSPDELVALEGILAKLAADPPADDA